MARHRGWRNPYRQVDSLISDNPYSKQYGELKEKAKAYNDDRLLELTASGVRFEANLRREQVKLMQRVFAQAGEEAVDGWLTINTALGQSRLP